MNILYSSVIMIFWILWILLILLILFILFILFVHKKEEKEEKEEKEKMGILPLHVYCISLEERRDRRDAFLERMTDMKNMKNNKNMSFLEMEMVNAVPYSSLTSSYFATKEMTSMTPGALGCLLSHVYVCLKFLSTGRPLALVMEDDASCLSSPLFSILQDINKDYLHSFDNFSSSFPSSSSWIQNYRILGKYDLLFLGVTNCVKDEKTCEWWKKDTTELDNMTLTCEEIRDHTQFSYLWGTHAYLMTQRSANLIVSQVLPLKKHYDMFLSDPELWKKFNLRCGVLTKSICMPVNPYDSNTN